MPELGPSQLQELAERYGDAWNRQDLDEVVAMHAPGFVFQNHTAGERAEGDAAREHIGRIFAGWPDLRFRSRNAYVRENLVVVEWTANATDGDGRRLEWDGVDLLPVEDGLFKRKDVYSGSARPRVLDE